MRAGGGQQREWSEGRSGASKGQGQVRRLEDGHGRLRRLVLQVSVRRLRRLVLQVSVRRFLTTLGKEEVLYKVCGQEVSQEREQERLPVVRAGVLL